jgi:hypothetical protein
MDCQSNFILSGEIKRTMGLMPHKQSRVELSRRFGQGREAERTGFIVQGDCPKAPGFRASLVLVCARYRLELKDFEMIGPQPIL